MLNLSQFNFNVVFFMKVTKLSQTLLEATSNRDLWIKTYLEDCYSMKEHRYFFILKIWELYLFFLFFLWWKKQKILIGSGCLTPPSKWPDHKIFFVCFFLLKEESLFNGTLSLFALAPLNFLLKLGVS